MANSILQGNMPFDRSIYSKADVDKIVEEHSHYIVSPAANTYIRPMDNGTGVIDRTIEVNKYLSITFGVDPTTGKATIDGYIPAHEGVPKEIVWSWTAPDAPAGGNYVMDLVGPFTSKNGSQVYVPSTSPVHDGFDPEAFYANLWGEIVEEETGIEISIPAGTECLVARSSGYDTRVVYDSDFAIECDDLTGGETIVETQDRVFFVSFNKDTGVGQMRDSSGPEFDIQYVDGSMVVRGTRHSDTSYTEVTPTDAVTAAMLSEGPELRIRYKNFPQWFTFDERGNFEGHDSEMAEGSCQGVYYEDAPSEVISDSRVIATLDDITEVVGVKYATQPPLGESDPVDNVVTVFHMPSGVAAGSYGEESDRTVAPGESFVVTKNGVNATGHVTDESEVSITLDVSAGNVMMGYDSNDRTVSEVIEEIQEEIGGGGSGGSIIQRLDTIEGRLDSNDETIEDIYGRLDSNDELIDDISNDLANHTHDFIVSPDGDTKVHANDDGTATIDVTGSDLALPVVRISPGSECSGTGSSAQPVSWPDGATIDFNDPRVVMDHGAYYYTEDGIRYVLAPTGYFVIQQVVGDVWEFSISEYASQSPALTFSGGSAYEASCTGTFSMSRDYAVDTKTVATTDQIVPFSRIVSDNGTVVVETHDDGNATISTGVKPGCVRVYQDFTGQPNDPKYPLTLEFSCSLDELASNPANRAFRILYDGTTYECTTGTGHQGIFPISGGPSWVESLLVLSVQDSSGNHKYIVLSTGSMYVFGNHGETYSTYEYRATEKTLATVDQIVPSDRIVSPDESARVVVHNDGTASIDTDTVVMSVPSDFTFMRITMAESGDVVMKGPYPYTYRGNTVYAWIASDLDPSTFNPFTARNDHLCLLGSTDSEPEFIALSGNVPFPVYNIQPGSWTSGTPIVSKAQNPSMYSGGDVSLSIGESREIATVDMLADLSNDIVGEIEERLNVVEGEIDDLSNDIGEVIDTRLTEIEGRIDDLSNDVYSAIDDLSNDVSLRAMDDNVVHKTGPLVEGQTIEVPIGIQTGSTELVEASGLGVTTPSLPDIGKPEIRTWFWGNDEGTDPDTGDTVEGRLGAGINLRLSPNDRRGVELVREATWNGSRFVNSASIWYGDNEIKIPEKSGTIALEEYMPVPSDETPKMDGTASPGTGAQASRWDHVHPSDSSKLDVADVISQDISYLDAPLYVNLGDYHKGDIVRTSYDIASCIGGSYFRAKKDTTSATSAFSSGDWCNDSKRNEYWEALGNSATVNRGDIVSYKGDLYRVKSDTWLTNADYPGSFQSELDFYLEKISLDDVDKSYIKEEAYGSRATIGQSSLTLSLQGQAPLVPFTLAIPDGFKLYLENGSSPHEVLYSAPSGGTTISFSTPPVYDQSYKLYVLVPDGYTFVDMDTMLRTDNLLWFESADPNSDSWGLDFGSSNGASGNYLGFDDFKSPNPTARYAQFGWAWANKIPTISRTAVSPVSKTVATEDQLPVPASEAPLADAANASVGTSLKYAREDHVHPLSYRIISTDKSTTVEAWNNGNAAVRYPSYKTTSVFFPEGFSIENSGATYTAPSGGETVTFKGPYKMSVSGYGDGYVWYPENLPDDPQEEFDPSHYNPWPWCLFGDTASVAGRLYWGGNFGFSISAWNSEHPSLTVDSGSSTVSGDLPTMTRENTSFTIKTLAVADHTHNSIVSGNTTVSAVNGGTATITKTVPPTYGNLEVSFAYDYSIYLDGPGIDGYSGPGQVEFKGPYYNSIEGHSYWYPTDLYDDPQDQFSPTDYSVWCLWANGRSDTPTNMMYKTGPYYEISDWNSNYPKITLASGMVQGSKPITYRTSSPNPSVVKTIATTDNVVTSVNEQHGDVSLDATNLYMDSTQTQSIAQAVASIPGGGIQSVNGDTGPDVLLDATNLYMDSNDQVTIAEAIDDAHLSPLYSDNRENSIVVTDSGYAELHALRMDGVSLLLHAGYSVSYEGVSYSAQSDEMIEMEGVHVRTIDGVTYYFWLPTTVQDPSDFNPFDGSSESVWYFWKQVDPGSPDADSAVPEFLSYANGPQYTVDGWYTDHTELSLVSGTESGDPPDTMYSKSAVQYKMLSSEDLSYDTPRMDGVPSPGQGEYAARWDHVHPSDSRKVDQGVNDSMFIQPDGAVQVIPAVYLYSTDNGIDANGDNIVTYIQAGSDNGGVFCKLIANESLESDSATVSGSMQLLYRIPVPGGTAYDTAVLFSADANFTRSSATSRSISISNVVTSGHDANGTEFSTTQTYRYIMNGSASIIDYTSTGGSFVINCGPLTWVSGGPDPNTTISIPSIKTLASTKYVDDAIAGISGTVVSVNGESGVVVLDADDIMMGYDSNDITIAEAIGGLDDRIGDIDSVLDAINGEVI